MDSKIGRIALYASYLLVAIGPIFLWRNTGPLQAEGLGVCMIAIGVISVLYGWLLVKRVLSGFWGIRSEQEKRIGQIACFEIGIIFAVAGILFLVRYYLN
jgi:hypothetical protein